MENKIISLIKDLRQKYGAVAIKSDLSAEYTTFCEMKKIREITNETDIDFNVKIGGCDAFNDICAAKEIRADAITAPMIETAYAAAKFTDNVSKVYSDEEIQAVSLRINIETAAAYRHADEIFARPENDIIKYVVLGRDDMAASVRLGRDSINSEIMLQAAKTLKSKALSRGKNLVLGGEIRPNAVNFIKNLKPVMFETRKVVFDTQRALDADITQGILIALLLEIYILEFKTEFNGYTCKGTRERINLLKSYTGDIAFPL